MSFGQETGNNIKTIRGFVFDYRGIPAAFAEITIKNIRTSEANRDGKFEIEAREGEALSISCNGWQTTVIVTEKNCYTVRLPEPNGLVMLNRFEVRMTKKMLRKVKRKIKQGFYDCND